MIYNLPSFSEVQKFSVVMGDGVIIQISGLFA